MNSMTAKRQYVRISINMYDAYIHEWEHAHLLMRELTRAHNFWGVAGPLSSTPFPPFFFLHDSSFSPRVVCITEELKQRKRAR